MLNYSHMFIKYILRVQSYQNHLNLVYGIVFVAIFTPSYFSINFERGCDS